MKNLFSADDLESDNFVGVVVLRNVHSPVGTSADLSQFGELVFCDPHPRWPLGGCWNKYDCMSSVRSHGIIAKIHGKFLTSLAKILP